MSRAKCTMDITIQNILYVVAAIVLIFGGIHILRGLFKFTWKLIRVGLLVAVIVLIAGVVLKFVNINLP
jgi:hypothetical protein